MKVAVYDTYVKRSNGYIAHFDIIVPDAKHSHKEVLAFGRAYLRSIQENESELTTEKCRFCHIETPTPEIIESIQKKGYFILEMEDILAVTLKK